MLGKFLLTLCGVIGLAAVTNAQTPAPIIVQAVTQNAPAATPAAAPPAVKPNESSVKTLEGIKAANDAILAKQAATLQQLEEMEKSAEQIRIYTKRG